jgi:hypothetical protein
MQHRVYFVCVSSQAFIFSFVILGLLGCGVDGDDNDQVPLRPGSPPIHSSLTDSSASDDDGEPPRKKRKEIVLSDTEAYTSDDDEGHTIVDYGTDDNYDSESLSPPSSPTSQTTVLLLP